MGAATFTKATDGDLRMQGRPVTPVFDNKRAVAGSIVLSGSYATGGDTLSLTGTGLTEVTQLLIEGTHMLGFGNTCGMSIVLRGTKAAPLIQAFDTNGSEVANATDLDGLIGIPVYLVGA